MRLALIPALAAITGLGLFAQEPVLTQRETGDLEVYAVRQEMVGDTRSFREAVEFRFNNVVLKCEELDYNENTGDVEARGQVHYRNLLSQEDLYAEKVAYNSRSELGTFYPIYQGQNLVGRKGAAPGLAIELEHGTTSSRHAMIYASARPGRVKIEDVGSTNGTFIGDLMLERGKKHELKDAEVVRFGGYVTIVKII